MLRRWRTRILLFLAVLGPGFITANVDNDSGGILTYSLAGAKHGYSLLWMTIPVTIALIVVQEMCARMGVVSGKGLSDMIREEFGLRLTFILMIVLVLVNYTNVVTEFIGIAGSLHLFHVTKFISVPLCALGVWFLVVKGNYKTTEKIFLVASLVYIAYIFAGVLSQPSWHDALIATVVLPKASVWSNRDYMYDAIGVVGTTIAPWMQFYLQSSIVEKGIRVKDYAASRLDVIVGSFFTEIVAWFIIVACAATLYVHGMQDLAVPADAAEAMRPLAGDYAFILFSFGLFNASVFAASILPLSTAYTVCEGLGFESGVDKSFKEAPFFYWLYTLLIAFGAITVLLLPDANLVSYAILSQVLNGVLLPVVIILMLLLINRHDLMGEHKNSRTWNLIAWGTSIIVIFMTLIMLWGMIPGH
ncbi:NRAMP family divalent metal transporter [Occallatibacter riparius]|uniref:Divalent metal cation transporter n=1 Tax=Occallatibacter riparius TaxID=1002689 RepID=A0A9J7BKD7_9BACT|nr:divalent metal cation transporter [Occallatibacter riparius]UWZ83340.1 divalent metal cation transporter [Occallatibacter riparius]